MEAPEDCVSAGERQRMRACTYSGKRVWYAVVNAQPGALAITACTPAERPFHRDVQAILRERIDALRDRPLEGGREVDLRTAWAWHGAGGTQPEDLHGMAHRFELPPVILSVRTRPLTCGSHASVTMGMRKYAARGW